MIDRSIQTQALSPQSERRSVRRRRYATHRPARCAGRPPNGGALGLCVSVADLTLWSPTTLCRHHHWLSGAPAR